MRNALLAAALLAIVLGLLFYGTPFIRLSYRRRKGQLRREEEEAERRALEEENRRLDDILDQHRKEQDE
jgi:flagellar biosynthesis/type III secretory pathway M-ring protein FliF/YscJ